MPAHRATDRRPRLARLRAGCGLAWAAWGRLARRHAAALLMTLSAAGTHAQSLDSLLGEGLAQAGNQPAPLVAPQAARGTVLPSQVLRWRQDAQALEHGDSGLPRDPARAATLYCQAARYGDAEAQYSLAWMLANGRGIERDDAQAAHLFVAAAEQGHPQAQRMAQQLGTPRGEPPPCLRPPEPARNPVAAALPVRPIAPQGANPVPNPAPTQAATSAPPAHVAAATGARIGQPAAAAGLTPLRPPPNAPAPIVNFVHAVAPDYHLPPQLVLAIMATESNFNPNAVSPKQAQGLMQLIPDTAARFKVRNPMDPAQNIRGGMAYLRWLMAYFEGDVALVAAAYNAGEGAVERYRGVPPYAETLNYVSRILATVGALKLPFDRSATAPSDQLPLMRRL